jgi:hypothetical protein
MPVDYDRRADLSPCAADLSHRDAEPLPRNADLSDRAADLSDRDTDLSDRDADVLRRAADLLPRVDDPLPRDADPLPRAADLLPRDGDLLPRGADAREAEVFLMPDVLPGSPSRVGAEDLSDHRLRASLPLSLLCRAFFPFVRSMICIIDMLVTEAAQIAQFLSARRSILSCQPRTSN